MKKFINTENRRSFTELENRYLRRYYSDLPNSYLAEKLNRSSRSIDHQGWVLRLKKSKEFMRSCYMKTAFTKGHVPANKGTKGLMKANKTTFRKGNIPPNTKFDGCISKRKHKRTGVAYKYIRISKGKWELYHRFVYERYIGPIPDRHIVIFIDGNQNNCDPSNLKAITMAENATRNRWPQYDPKIGELNKILKTAKTLLKNESKNIKSSSITSDS